MHMQGWCSVLCLHELDNQQVNSAADQGRMHVHVQACSTSDPSSLSHRTLHKSSMYISLSLSLLNKSLGWCMVHTARREGRRWGRKRGRRLLNNSPDKLFWQLTDRCLPGEDREGMPPVLLANAPALRAQLLSWNDPGMEEWGGRQINYDGGR